MLYCSIVESICVSVREPNASYFSPSLEYNWLFKRDVHDDLGSIFVHFLLVKVIF